MIIPRQFYYSETQSAIEYTRTPTGAFAINEYLAGNPFWIAAALPRVDKPKKLVLADWTASAWFEEKDHAVQQLLRTLIEQGFSVYLWQKERVVSMGIAELSNLEQKSICQDITLAFPDEVITAAVAQHHIPRDHVQIIDDYWLNQILSEQDELQPRILRTSELPLLSHADADKLVAILSASTPALSHIIHDESSKQARTNADLLMNKFNHISMKQDYKYVVFNDLDALYCSNDNIYNNIEDVDFRSDLKTPSLNLLLNTRHHLKKLSLNKCLEIEHQPDLIENNITYLEDITLILSTLLSENIRALLTAPQLKRLKLSLMNEMSDDFELKNRSFPCLERIDFNNLTLSADNWRSFLSAPRLKIITLKSCSGLNIDIELKITGPLCIEELNLSDSPIALNNLNAFVSNTPNLRKLTLRGCTILSGELGLNTNGLTCVEELDLTDCNLSPENRKKLMDAIPNLKILRLNNNLEPNFSFTFDSKHITSLEYIDFTKSNVLVENLSELFAAPKLNTDFHRSFKSTNLPLTKIEHSLIA